MNSNMTATEAFPLLSTADSSCNEKSGHLIAPAEELPRKRRTSGLGEIRAGDTGSALATWDRKPPSPGTLKAQSDRDRKKPFSKRRKARTLFQQWKRYALKHTWVSPLVLIVVFIALYAINPTRSNPIHHFLFLSYPIEAEPGSAPGTPLKYGKGWWDCAFVAFWTIVLSFTREFIMQTILRPLARTSGLKSRGKQSRFMEQMYTAIYFGFTGPWGLYVMSQTSLWYFNTRAIYEHFPHRTLDPVYKFYYLFQAAYWSQQAIVLLLGMEKPRKDFKELVGHHIVSLSLITLSYRFHFTHMGLGVFITHDISDFFLATSKTLNYLDHPLVAPYFAVFVVAWIYMRHYLNLRIIYSLFTEFQTVGPYGLNWEAEQYKCDISFYITTFLLACLQSLNLFWLWNIFRIAYTFVWLNTLEDDRSEAEDDDEIDEKEALAKEGLDEIAIQKILANGNGNGHHMPNGKHTTGNGNPEIHVNGNGHSEAPEIHTDGLTNRKENGRPS